MRKKNNNQDQAPDLLVDTQLERAFLSALFTDIYANAHLQAVAHLVSDDDFTSDEFCQTWQAVKKCYEQGKEISPINVYASGKEMGFAVNIARYISSNSLTANAEALGKTLHGLGQRRRLAERVQDVFFSLIYDPETTTEQALAEVERIVKETTATSDKNCETFAEVYRALLKQTQDKANGLVPQGVPSGFSLIDRKGGLERGELMVVAGRNSNGKTSLALCMALNASLAGVPVGIFSLEMTNLQLTTRLTSLLTGIDGEAIKRGQMSTEEWDKFVAVNDQAPIYFDKRRSTDSDAVVANIKGMVAQLGVQVVVIDYLQLLRGKERERLQQIGGIAHRLEALSKQLGITIILLSQLRRNQPNDPVPKLEELKESGDIADASDSIYLVYRPERHGQEFKFPDMSQNWSQYSTSGTALLICAKNRQGAMNGEQLLGFDAGTTRFYEKAQFALADDNGLPQMDDIFN